MRTPANASERQHLDAIHDRIRQAILRGDFAPGDQLSQVRLAQHLGVSRTPLREALRMLIDEGLLEDRPNRKLRVAGFSIDDLEQLYVRRVALESVAIRITVPRLSSREIGSMEGLLAEMSHFAGERDYESWELPHRALHQAFVAGAGTRVCAVLTRLSEHAGRYRRAYTTRAERAWAAGLAEHRAIVDACRRRDPDGAARALAEHLGHTALGVIALSEPTHDTFALRTAIAAAAAPVPEAPLQLARPPAEASA